jgi:hypothetical protein
MQAWDLNCKHKTTLEEVARDKHLSLLRKIVNYGLKQLITLAPGVTVAHLFINTGSNPGTFLKNLLLLQRMPRKLSFPEWLYTDLDSDELEEE